MGRIMAKLKKAIKPRAVWKAMGVWAAVPAIWTEIPVIIAEAREKESIPASGPS
jgi:hypothetical protein